MSHQQKFSHTKTPDELLKEAKSIMDLPPTQISDLVRQWNLKCFCCDYNETICEFHHIENKLKNDHKKLTYVCPNCRKKIQNGLIRKNSLITLYDAIGENWKTPIIDESEVNVVFLDLDGVLNTLIDGKKRHAKFIAAIKNNEPNPERYIKDQYGILFDDMCVHFFERLINISKAKIVLTSSWKESGLSVIQQMWKDRKLPGEVISITQNDGCTRGDQINDWLSAQGMFYEIDYDNPYSILWDKDAKKCLVSNYVIIDDNRDMSLNHYNHFVQTNPAKGFDVFALKRALSILNVDYRKHLEYGNI